MSEELIMKIWGRTTSSNVQKVMWAIGEMGLRYERLDVGGPFGKNKEPAYLAMNPNGLVPTLEEDDGFLLWESNSIMRYLAAKHQSAVLEPAITPVFWGMIRTPPDKRDGAAIAAGKQKTGDAVKMLDDRLAKTQYLAGDAFSYGDIPAGIMVRRYRDLVPERPAFQHVERWYAAIAARPAFDEHVTKIPLV
jgi:glutathione S-transferase